jgi:hypothetical protein
MTDFWPHLVLRPGEISCQYLARTTAGTVAASGFTQRIASPAGAWRIQYRRIVIKDITEVRAWRAVEAGLDGGAVAIYVPLIGEEQGTIDGVLVGAHAQGDTVAVIRRVGDIMADGYHFAVGDGRLHRVVDVTGVSTDDYTCTIRPPLRADYADATTVEIGTPICKCRLASDDAMALTVTPGGMAVADVTFLEDPN